MAHLFPPYSSDTIRRLNRPSRRLKVALIAPPFIPVPPVRYGGTELFIAQLATALDTLGIEVIVYANGESKLPGLDVRSRYKHSQWPLTGDPSETLNNLDHASWAVHDAVAEGCDAIHLNDAAALVCERFSSVPFVYTLHHPKVPAVSAFYKNFPEVEFVAISNFQGSQESVPRLRTIHHGLRIGLYHLQERKAGYLSFIGRIAPCKGPHLAIQAAQAAGMPLKIAGEIQPLYQDYFAQQIRPHLDGRFIEYVGEVDLAQKNQLLGDSSALLFPIQWDEPFGLVMVEAMACGTPVLALRGGSVPEIVKNGLSGFVCRSAGELARCVRDVECFSPGKIRDYVQTHFSAARMAEQYRDLYQEVAGKSPKMAPADFPESSRLHTA
jgi:glycosyltransferase involved in cell wall biosynthesis